MKHATAPGDHDECDVCAGEGTSLWFTPQGTTETRLCTGIDYEDALGAGLIRRGARQGTPE